MVGQLQCGIKEARMRAHVIRNRPCVISYALARPRHKPRQKYLDGGYSPKSTPALASSVSPKDPPCPCAWALLLRTGHYAAAAYGGLVTVMQLAYFTISDISHSYVISCMDHQKVVGQMPYLPHRLRRP